VEKYTGMDSGSEGHYGNGNRSRGSRPVDLERKSRSDRARNPVHASRGTGGRQPERPTERGYAVGLPQWYRISVVIVTTIGIVIVMVLMMHLAHGG
jgi:hypothetical protein